MADLIYIAVIIAFFALAALFVVACDRIIGADQAQSAGAVSRGDHGDRQDRAPEIGAA